MRLLCIESEHTRSAAVVAIAASACYLGLLNEMRLDTQHMSLELPATSGASNSVEHAAISSPRFAPRRQAERPLLVVRLLM